MTPSYIDLKRSGELKRRVDKAIVMLATCVVCPRNCRVNRLEGELGTCCTGRQAVISSYGPHFGEEPPLVGKGGSGTIFFSHCNMKCVYCQNYSISQTGQGEEVSAEQLSNLMLHIQAKGCTNINLVSPSHVVPQILEGLSIAIDKGLTVPLVYNSGGYDSIETLRLLDGVVDIYMPDIKYADENTAKQLSDVDNYPQINQQAIKEMHRQVGDLTVNYEGVAQRGLLIRHLVLPGGLAGTRDIVKFVSQQISTNTYLNIMDQYRPEYKAYDNPLLARPLQRQEFLDAVELAQNYGLKRMAHLEPRFRIM